MYSFLKQPPQSKRSLCEKRSTASALDYKCRNSSKTTKGLINPSIDDQRSVNTEDVHDHSSTTT